MPFRFIHIADVHLDTPFMNRDKYMRDMLRNAIFAAFQASIDLALAKRVNALLIAGDLFDSENMSFNTEKFLLDQLKRLKKSNIDVYYATGNHDPSVYNSKLNKIPWPDNVHIFTSRIPQTLEIKDSKGNIMAFITGAGHEGMREPNNIAAAYPKSTSDIPHIGLLHCLLLESGDADMHERYAPCNLNDLCSKGYTYWALGHVHNRREFDNHSIIYPGNIVGRNPRETGLKGAYLVEIEGDQVKQQFYPLSPVCWLNATMEDLNFVGDFYTLEDKICRYIQDVLQSENFSGNILFRLVLKGPCPLYNDLRNYDDLQTLKDHIESSMGLAFLEILTDDLLPPINVGKYRNAPHVLSTVLDLIEKAKEDDELLLALKPDILAENIDYIDKNALVRYLRNLLDDLDYEAAFRLIGEDIDET